MRRRIIITGLERSGTSCVARVLDCLGVPIESPGECHAEVKLNPTGYYEDPKVNQMLENRAWGQLHNYVQQRRDYPLWGLKDPRLSVSFVMDRFLECFPEDECVTILVVRRDSKEIHQSWARCGMRRPLSEVEERQNDLQYLVVKYRRTIVVPYSAFILNTESTVRRIAEDLGLYTSPTQLARAIQSVEPKLKHF